MSDPVVINAFKSRVGELVDEGSPGVSIPCIETLNVRVATLPDKFTTIERDYSTTDRITLGVPTQFRETGTISVVVHVQSGKGAVDPYNLAERVRDLFHNYSVGYLQVLTVGSAVYVSPDDGNFFELKVPITYMFDFFKT